MDMENLAKELFAGLSRRHFLRTSAGATLAAVAGGEPRLLFSKEKIEPKADTLILLWMAGGMAQTETFDPKAYTPFERGMESKRVLSTFPSIDTVVDNIKLSQGFERIAQVMDRATLIRSHRVGDLGFILHSRHQYHWHTGYAPPLSVAAPHMGAVIARTQGPKNPDIPAFIDIGQNLEIGAESDAVKAFHTAGFLGTEYGPFLIADPSVAAASVQPSAEMGAQRFRERYGRYRRLVEANPILKYGSDYQQESLLRSVENAHRLLTSPAAKAFDLTLEPKKSYDIYNTSRFGRGCLLARRLTEAGARFVEVTTEYIPFRYWDTHENGHERTIGLKQTIDAPVSQLVLDLEERGLLNRTLIVLASEFGRDMMVEGKPDKRVKDQVTNQPDIMTEPKHYGMHRHFTEACGVLLFGGGFKKGFLYGKTADERPCKIVENPVTIEDLHATIYHAMGIPPDLAYEVEKRPFHVTKDGKGKPVLELFA
ncbi:MAG: DUF1501 domain-containing protein [Acidobacteria bacterium]|nr:DUF1501 domain-containing protein [Acidobacteriota bacterium]